MAELTFVVLSNGHSARRISLDVEEHASCSEVLESLLHWLEVPARDKGAWHLAERWENCGRLFQIKPNFVIEMPFVYTVERIRINSLFTGLKKNAVSLYHTLWQILQNV